MKLYTIGFTQKSAEGFFSLLRSGEIKTLVDVRLNNNSQLAGFAKRDDLAFFLRELCQIDYLQLPELAPTKPLLAAYRDRDMTWDKYQEAFLELMMKRRIEHQLTPELLSNSCLLCSEHLPHQCHRRLVAEYLTDCWAMPIHVEHLF